MADLAPADRRRAILICTSVLFSVAVTLGVSWPMLALVLERQGVPVWLNGLNASAQMAAVLLILPFGPRLLGRFGTRRVMAGAGVVLTLSLLALAAFPNIWAWFAIRFVLGFASELMFTAGDLWVNQVAEERSRGRAIAIFNLFPMLGFGVGPVLISLLGTEDWTALYVAAAVAALGLAPLGFAGRQVPALEGRVRARFGHFIRYAPSLLVAALMFGLVESSILSLMPIYGLDRGLAEEVAATMITLFVLGSVTTSIPMGWLSDHMDRRRLLTVNVGVAAASVLFLDHVVSAEVARAGVLFCLGASVGSFYSLAMAMMGQRYKGHDLVSINACFVFMWGLGMMSGPSITGAAMDAYGPAAMPATTGALCLAFFVMLLLRARQPDQAHHPR